MSLDLTGLASSESCFSLDLVLEQACIPVPEQRICSCFLPTEMCFHQWLKSGSIYCLFPSTFEAFIPQRKMKNQFEVLCLLYGWHFCSVGPYQEIPSLRTFPVLFVGILLATHSSTLAWKIPQMEEPNRLQSMGSQRVRHDWATSLSLWCLRDLPNGSVFPFISCSSPTCSIFFWWSIFSLC